MTKIICTTLLVEKSPQALPLGAACVASAIKHYPGTEKECEVKLVSFSREDEEIQALQSDEQKADFITARLLTENPQIVCMSVFVWNRTIFELCAERLHKQGVIIIAGGPEITAHPDIFENSFDYTVSGEGEYKVPRLIEKLISEGGKKLGKEEVLSCYAGASNSTDLSLLHSPYLDGTIDPTEFGGALWELARGCPFKCSYCYESKGEKTVRLFPEERIDKELELFARKKVPQVFVLDPTYNANKERALALLKKIARITPDTFYYFEARAEFIDHQLARAFTKIPCALQIGLQSADENVLRKVNRPFNKKLFVKNINILNQEGVTFGLDLIYGLPGETFASFWQGINFAVSLYPNNLEIFCLSVLPGTDLFDRAQELGLTFEDTPPYNIIKTDKFSPTDKQKAFELAQACTYFYNDGRAVPWFMTICRSLRIKPAEFFRAFYDYAKKNALDLCCCEHKIIEENQIKFLVQAFKQHHLEKYIKAATDIIRFNGAISRKTATGTSEKIRLTYPPEYIDSQYSLDLDFFVKNVGPRPCEIKI